METNFLEKIFAEFDARFAARTLPVQESELVAALNIEPKVYPGPQVKSYIEYRLQDSNHNDPLFPLHVARIFREVSKLALGAKNQATVDMIFNALSLQKDRLAGLRELAGCAEIKY